MAEGEKSKGSGVAGLLQEAGKQLIPVLLTAGSLIGFVAFAGGVIVWTRFSAAKVPPDQAVNAVPRDELVAIGSALLLLFGFFGALALIGAFLTDRGARATPGMARGLLGLFLIEGVTTIIVAGGLSVEATIADAALLALPVAAAFWATFSKRYVALVDDLPPRPYELTGPRDYKGFLLSPPGLDPSWVAWVGIVGSAVIVGPIQGSARTLAIWVGAWLLLFLFFLVVDTRREVRARRQAIGEARTAALENAQAKLAEERRYAGSGFRDPEEPPSTEFRLLNERPERLDLNLAGSGLIAALLIAGAVLPWCRLGDWWVGVSITAAAALCVALWRIAALSAQRVVWYGVAVFLSVPLFGTLMTMARNVDDPQVQPMALIRNTDGPSEAIQGLYVTEADERVYFATVASEGCGDELTPHSGRLEWVPKSEVVAMSVGPLQSVEEAGRSALEMAYALTPAVESSLGFEAGLKVRSSKKTDKAETPLLDKRLESTGPAVRPNFGGGLTLTPEDASPGDEVTLRMSKPNPNEDVEGFGRARNGRTLRVGGVRARIVKQSARTAEGSEYLHTIDGRLLKLAKGEPYVKKGDGEFKSVAGEPEPEDGKGPPRYLLLSDPQVLRVNKTPMEPPGIPLELKRGSVAPQLDEESLEVTMKAQGEAGALGEKTTSRLDRHPVGQAWNERQIKFEVPPGAASGAVSVECSQLAGQPLLRVSHAPEARIWVRTHGGSNHVTFDGRRSTDVDEETVVRRWNVAGLRRGDVKQLSPGLAPRPGAYTVRLTATDEGGSSDTAVLRVLRLPASLFKLGARWPRKGQLKPERRALVRAMQGEPPATIEIDGFAGDLATPEANASLSMRRAEDIGHVLLRRHLAGVAVGADVKVRMLGYGEGCPSRHTSHNHRVDVFLLGEGVTMAPPAGCRPRRMARSEWNLLAAGVCAPPRSPNPRRASFAVQLRALVHGFIEYVSGHRLAATCANAQRVGDGA